MRIMQLYKHKRNTDVAIMPTKPPRYSATRNVYKVRVHWFNIVNPRNVFNMNVPETIEIKAENMKDWEPYDAAV